MGADEHLKRTEFAAAPTISILSRVATFLSSRDGSSTNDTVTHYSKGCLLDMHSSCRLNGRSRTSQPTLWPGRVSFTTYRLYQERNRERQIPGGLRSRFVPRHPFCQRSKTCEPYAIERQLDNSFRCIVVRSYMLWLWIKSTPPLDQRRSKRRLPEPQHRPP